MAHPDDASTYADLLAKLGDDGTKELFRRLLEQALQDLVDAELTAQIGVGPIRCGLRIAQASTGGRHSGRTRCTHRLDQSANTGWITQLPRHQPSPPMELIGSNNTKLGALAAGAVEVA